MNYIFYKGTFTDIPSTWDELTGKQYVNAIDVLLLQAGTLQEKQFKLFKILSKWGWWKMAFALKWFRWNPLRLIKLSVRRMRTAALSDFDTSLNRTFALAQASEEFTQFLFTDITLTQNVLPFISKKGKLLTHAAGNNYYTGPAADLANMRMNEFVYAENYFIQWRNKNQAADLNNLVAILYRPYNGNKRPDIDDLRISFNPNICALQVKKIEQWPLNLRIAIAEMYGSMRRKKMEENPRVFSENDGESESLYGLWSVMRQVAKQGHFGKFSDIEETYVDTVLMELNESLAEAERLEAEMENAKG